MSRRAQCAFGGLLDLDPKGMITCGIGIASTNNPTVSYISPTDGITETGIRRDIAGLTFEFLYAPDTEAPEEMHIWIPQLKALTCAENANRMPATSMRPWNAGAIRPRCTTGRIPGPVWGNAEIAAFIESQRDSYKYIHDQALRLANKAYTPLEAAAVIELPAELGRKWYNRAGRLRDPAAPFGGVMQPGLGREGAHEDCWGHQM
jgi:alkyl sulfatase BDS1-like metallo-beta-lactamase superfamily hydrolase